MNKLKDKINPGHYHEMMDRLHVIMSTLDDHILQHPVAKVHKELNSHLNKCSIRSASTPQLHKPFEALLSILLPS